MRESRRVGYISVIRSVVFRIVPSIAYRKLTILEVSPGSFYHESKLVDFSFAHHFEHTTYLVGLTSVCPMQFSIGRINAFSWYVNATVAFGGKAEIRLVYHIAVYIHVVITS